MASEVDREVVEAVERAIADRGMRRGSGSEAIFLCPVHDDSHPSARYNRLKQVWWCHCGAGGGVIDLAQKLGVMPVTDNRTRTLVCEYQYVDEKGECLYKKLRYEPKTFALAAPDGKFGIDGLRRILYNTNRLAARPEERVLIVEGEKDVLALDAYGFLGVTNFEGAGKWRDEYTQQLIGRECIIIPDNDEPGREHALLVHGKLAEAGIKARVLHLPGLKPKGDVSDYLMDHEAADLLALIENRERDGYDTVENILGRDRAGRVAIPSGFAHLDSALSGGGFQPGQLVIIAARPSVGKSAFACGTAFHAARQGRKVLLFSLEMSAEQMSERVAGYGEFERESIFIDESMSHTVDDIVARSHHVKAEEDGLDLIIVDYLQLMEGTGSGPGNRVQDVSHMSRRLKMLARQLEVPVIALSQLSRDIEKREDPTPKLSDLRESGSIEQDADIVIFLDREEMRNEQTDLRGVATAFLAKQREGPRGKLPLQWRGATKTFYDATEDDGTNEVEHADGPF